MSIFTRSSENVLRLKINTNYNQVAVGSVYNTATTYYVYDLGLGKYVEYDKSDLSGEWNETTENSTTIYTLKDTAELFTAESSLVKNLQLKTILSTKYELKDATEIYTATIPTVTGSVTFNELKVTSIGLTDYKTYAIDGTKVQSNLHTVYDKDLEKDVEEAGIYADKYNNLLILANKDSKYSSANKYEYKTTAEVDVFDDQYTWNDIFSFENTDLQDFINVTGLSEIKQGTTGYDMYQNMESLWQYYISRDSKIDFTIEQFRQAYNSGDLKVEITDIIEETKDDKDEDKDKEDEDKSSDSEDKDKDKEDEGVNYIASPFNDDNYALKLDNNNTNIELGITSNAFTVKQMEYLKLTVWVYSPDKDAEATVTINSVQPTRNQPVYGTLLSSSSTVDANVLDSINKVTNEYGWVPVHVYIEGNALHDQDCYLVLTASKDSTVYFDNITIQRVASSAYDTAKSDSNDNTCAISLSPSSSLISTGVSNGTFDLVSVTTTEEHSKTTPRTAKSWSVKDIFNENIV